MKNLILIIAFLFVCLSTSVQAQKRKRGKVASAGNVETTQWWIGFKGGLNLSTAEPENTYHFFSYTQDPISFIPEKQYDSFSELGSQFGFIISWEFYKSASINLMPAYTIYNYAYTSEYQWNSTESQEQRVSSRVDFVNQAQYVEFPITLKYEFTTTKMKPYLQIGFYYGWLINAYRSAEINGLDAASGSDQELTVSRVSAGAKDAYKSTNYGLLGGGGFTYNVGNARLGLEINYKQGLENVTNSYTRYDDSAMLTGLYDVMDDVKLKHLEFTINFYIPLKFITSKDYRPL